MPTAEKKLYCLVCRKTISVGEEYATYPTNRYSCRHVGCISKPPRPPKKPAGRKPTGGPKRQRAAGHGYSGGTGFITLK